MLHQRCLRAAALGCGLVIAASTAHAQPPLDCTGPMSPTGLPIALSDSKHYFIYKNAPLSLQGQSYEYICHIAQPQRDQTYCTLKTYKDLFTAMQSNRNNVIRLEAIFDHSPGWMSQCNFKNPDACVQNPTPCPTGPGCCGTPFANEQPFAITSGGKWDLDANDQTYLNNLDNVVCDAYKKDIIVEVSLFNVWDGKFYTSPFNPDNTVNRKGFASQKYFMTFDASNQDGSNPVDTQQANITARDAQIRALKAVVNQLKKYPNVIWEVANEPDFILSQFNDPIKHPEDFITHAQVFAWQEKMVTHILEADKAHLIEIEGHTIPTFARNDSRASVESAHYVKVAKTAPPGGENPTYYGAIDLVRGFYPNPALLPITPVGFNETITVPPPLIPNCQRGARTNDDGRPEAWEFMIAGGGLFDGYSLDKGANLQAVPPVVLGGVALNMAQDLKRMADFLVPQGTVGPAFLDDMRQADCPSQVSPSDATHWCAMSLLPATAPSNGASDPGTCPGNGANIYWSTIQSAQNKFYVWGYESHALYIHHGIFPSPSDDFQGYSAVPCGSGTDNPPNGYNNPGLQYLVNADGCYQERWLDPATGVVKAQSFVSLAALTWTHARQTPHYRQDILLLVQRAGTAKACGTDPILTASYTFNCNYLYCNFDASGSYPSNSISSYNWNWGDGTTSASGNPLVVHNFAWPGSYTVTLTVADALGDSGSASQTVPVAAQPPTSSFYALCNLTTCTFYSGNSKPGSAAIHSYSWTFGDGATDIGPFPSHTYAAGGSYAVTLIVTDDFNISTASTVTVAVTGPPAARFAFSCSGLACSFDAGGSTPGSSPISTYGWAFGDGAGGSGVTVSHTYATGGTYTVTLTATDTQGQAGTQSQQVTVTPPVPPAASFIFTCGDQTITSVSSIGVGTCVIDANQAGDANYNAAPQVQPSFAVAKGDQTITFTSTAPAGAKVAGPTYNVTATASSGLMVTFTIDASATSVCSISGSTVSFIGVGTCVIDANQAGNANYNAAPRVQQSFAVAKAGLACSFDASGSSAGSNPIASYSWSFGDAASGSGTTSSHTYPAPASYTVGRYSVTLTVTDSANNQSSVVRMVSVNGDPPLPAESYFALPPCRVLDTRYAPFTALTNGQAQTFQITGKCGIPSSAKAVSLTVTVAGPTGGGYLVLFPGDKTPTVTSIDFDPARSPRATTTIELLALNGAGTIGVLPAVAGSPGQVHLILDVDGYYSEDTTPAPGAQGPLGYQTITPCRIVDTRTNNTPLVSGTASKFTIQGSCGIPTGAVTAALNAAIVAPSTGGNSILYQSSLAGPPLASNSNWIAGTSAIANGARPTLAATVPDLAAWFVSSGPGNTAHLVLDTMGYFKAGAPYKYHPVAECRAAYTASPGESTPSLAAGTTRSFQVQGNCGVPVGAKAAFIKTSLHPLDPTTAGLLLLFPSGGSPNGTSFMNWDAGEVWMSGGAIVALSSNNADISVATSSNADLIIKVFGYFQ